MVGREKEVSTRLLRPTLPHIHLEQLMVWVERWDPIWEIDGSIKIFDEGIAQFMLCDPESHMKYYAAVVLGKASVRCSLINEEPDDLLDAQANRIHLVSCCLQTLIFSYL
ncbi:hypothetical protein WR25_24754 isoform B [Diploscapter pachys]|uniref:Uncharacterized protein n=1 Tax=Diploscapter pachys TaxID=2018661 RepID=A0A2A2KQI6_9BILA|nr:hypothetical protein WR25_24754 isoform B [Diploscapter pachys]